jgi:hypothetical protein
MEKTRRMIGTVHHLVKELDPNVIVDRTFYDDASGRLFISLVLGQRGHEFNLHYRDFDKGDLKKLSESIQAGVEAVQHQPIG